MKRILIVLLMVGFVSWAMSAYGQVNQGAGTQGQAAKERVEGKTATTTDGAQRLMNAGDRLFKATDLIGTKVKNGQGEDLGKISNLAIMPGQGRVPFAVLSQGGFLGIGAKLIAVPLSALTFEADQSGHDRVFFLNMTNEQLAAIPNFANTSWPDMANRKWAEDQYRYFGQEPHWDDRAQTK